MTNGNATIGAKDGQTLNKITGWPSGSSKSRKMCLKYWSNITFTPAPYIGFDLQIGLMHAGKSQWCRLSGRRVHLCQFKCDPYGSSQYSVPLCGPGQHPNPYNALPSWVLSGLPFCLRSVLTASGSVEYSIKSVELQFHIFMWFPCAYINIDEVNYILIRIFSTIYIFDQSECWMLYIIIIIRVLLHMCKPTHIRFMHNNKGILVGNLNYLHFGSLHLWHIKTIQGDSLEFAVNKNILFH